VPLGAVGVRTFFHLAHWPDGAATHDLRVRLLDVLPIPGHEASHIAVYDPRTQILFTGDTLYRGLLSVDDWPAYAQSSARFDAFARAHSVSFVLGGRVEMTDRPGHWFGCRIPSNSPGTEERNP
jgi:glyoxylase-like metal-dependent hydrolase (beta-lactamase superfamily II)